MSEEISSARETLRARSARRDRRRQLNAAGTNPPDPAPEPPAETTLMVRLKDPNQMAEERPKSRLGQLNPFSRGEQSFPSAKSEIKETLKRPLSSLFRRPGSKAGREPAGNARESGNPDEIQEIPTEDNSNESKNRINSAERVPLNLDTIARAPEFTVNHVIDIYNYDLPGFENPEIKKLDDIDLTLLIRFLQLEEEVADEQVPWTWDYLYANVLTETREEWDPDEELPDNP